MRRAEQIDEMKSLGADVVISFDGDRDDPLHLKTQVQSAMHTPADVRYSMRGIQTAEGIRQGAEGGTSCTVAKKVRVY